MVRSAGVSRDVDVNIQVPDATVSDLLEALGQRTRSGDSGVAVDGRHLQGYLAMVEAGLHDGAVVHTNGTAGASASTYTAARGDRDGGGGSLEQDKANVRASVACAPPGGEVNSFVLTKFTSPEALDSHYRSLAALSGVPVKEGDSRSCESGDGAYVSDSGQSSGRVLCYQQRGSSFLSWTDKSTQTMGSAAR